MNRLNLGLFHAFAFVIICGCSGPDFTNLGNDVGVPTASIDEYADSMGITRDKAKQQMLEESKARAGAGTPGSPLFLKR